MPEYRAEPGPDAARSRAADLRIARDELAGPTPDELARELAAARERVEHLETALETNRRIAMALGILMARRRLTEDQAFTLLRSVSQREHRKLRDIADGVVYTGDLPGASG